MPITDRLPRGRGPPLNGSSVWIRAHRFGAEEESTPGLRPEVLGRHISSPGKACIHMTITPELADVHQLPVSLLAGQATGQAPNDVFGVIAVVVVIMLLGFALDGLRTVVSSLWAMSRLLFSALGVAISLVAALAVLIGAVIVAIIGD
ncbi:hypothetical protein LDL48_37675 [Wangella sp. NEAU-J3]|nr:hypothetical protein [Jidongwangia harbinensis]